MTATPRPAALSFARAMRSRVAVLLLASFVGAAAAPAHAAGLPSVTGASVGTSADTTVVRIALSAEGAAPVVSPFRQSNPDRLVLDIAGATLADGALLAASGMVERADFDTFGDSDENVRVTLYLTGAATFAVSGSADAVVVTLTPGVTDDPLASALGAAPAADGVRLSGPRAAASGPALTTLDFQQRDRTSRVIIGAQASEPAVSQPEKDVIAVDLPGATLPESLRRELDTRFFYSAVDSVRATTTRAGTRVTVRLRAGAEYEVKKEGGLTVLEVQIPQDVQVARADALRNVQSSLPAAPSTPDTNGTGALGNASGQEVYVTGSGRKVDAAAVFGSGNGANTPGAFTYASDMGSVSTAPSSGRRMSIDLQDADIHAVFRFIAEFADVNIVASDDVEGKVTVRLKDVPWDEALGAVLQAKGLGSQRFGNILRVAPIDTIKAEQQAALEAKKASADLVDLPLYVAPLNYAQADEVEEQVKSVLSARGTIQVDSRGNQLIIRDAEENIAQARALLVALDKPNREVDIQARFVEATSSMTRSLGIQWGSELDASAATGYPTGAFFPSDVRMNGGITSTGAGAFYSQDADNLLVDLGSPSGTTSAMAFSLGSIPGLVDITARISALEKEGTGRLVSNPHVRTLDNETARVAQGARVPFVSVGQAGTQVQFIQAELSLDVTPHITSEGMIFMDLTLTNNRPDFTQTVLGNPAIQTKEIETRVLVADGDTIVLGGVYATTESVQQNRVPGLGKIPILGYLFKNSSRERSQNEMLVFVTPTIVPVESKE